MPAEGRLLDFAPICRSDDFANQQGQSTAAKTRGFPTTDLSLQH
jgi:hypothetical protein